MAWRGEIEDGLGWGGLVASKSEQRAEAKQHALEKDARRYRWLRTAGNAHDVYAAMFFNGKPEDMDAAIDEAMRA